MSSGAGHIQDMINRFKQNRANRPSNRVKFKEHHREINYTSNKNLSRLNFKKVSKMELSQINSEIRRKALEYRRKEKLIFLSVVIFAVLVISGGCLKRDLSD